MTHDPRGPGGHLFSLVLCEMSDCDEDRSLLWEGAVCWSWLVGTGVGLRGHDHQGTGRGIAVGGLSSCW